MKKIVVSCLLASLLFPAIAHSGDVVSDFVAGNDKVYHLGVSAVIGFSSGVILNNTLLRSKGPVERVAYTIGLTLLPGLAKELTDDKFSLGDMTANLIGAGVGCLFAESVSQFVIVPSGDGVSAAYMGVF